MGKSKSGSVKEVLGWCGGILLLMTVYALILLLYDRTLVEWWRPTLIAIILAGALWFVCGNWWKRIWSHTGVWILAVGHFISMTGLMLLLVLAINKWGADHSTIHTEQVTVAERVRETHYHTQRVGRRHYRQGTPYYKYYLMLEFHDGRKKKYEVSLSRYNHTRTGSEMTLEMETGLLGYPVITGKPLSGSEHQDGLKR